MNGINRRFDLTALPTPGSDLRYSGISGLPRAYPTFVSAVSVRHHVFFQRCLPIVQTNMLSRPIGIGDEESREIGFSPCSLPGIVAENSIVLAVESN